MRRSIPLDVWFRRSSCRNHNRFAGRFRIYYFSGRLLTVDRLLTNEVVLAVLPAPLVRFGFWLILVSAIKPLVLVLLAG